MKNSTMGHEHHPIRLIRQPYRVFDKDRAMALSRTFGLSRRQAYRYLELARAGAPAPSAAENSVTITVKMPESLALGLRARATEGGVTTSEVVRQSVAAFLAAKRRHG